MLNKLWDRLPTFLKALFLGVATFEVLQLGQILMAANLQWGQNFPWVVPLVFLYLLMGWKYLSGSGWPGSTRQARQIYSRTNLTEPKRLRLGFLAALFILLHLVGLAVFTSSIIAFPPESFTPPEFVSALPVHTAFPLVLTFALVAGVCEEVGFRGYMQVHLEKVYGVVPAVLIVTVVFWLAHYSHASFLHRTILLLSSGLFAGFLSYYSRSLYPAITVHVLADAIGFSTVSGFFGLPKLYSASTIWQTGIDVTFVSYSILMVVSGGAAILALIRMARLSDTKNDNFAN